MFFFSCFANVELASMRSVQTKLITLMIISGDYIIINIFKYKVKGKINFFLPAIYLVDSSGCFDSNSDTPVDKKCRHSSFLGRACTHP